MAKDVMADKEIALLTKKKEDIKLQNYGIDDINSNNIKKMAREIDNINKEIEAWKLYKKWGSWYNVCLLSNVEMCHLCKQEECYKFVRKQR